MYRNILPEPQNITVYENEVTLAPSYNISSFKESYPYVYQYLSSFITISDNAKNTISYIQDATMMEEEYKLYIDADIKIVSKHEKGAFRAVSTLKQIMHYKSVKKAEIHDYPQIKNRGFMLDISRGKVPKKTSILEYIDILTDLKYNQLQLYMEDIVFEFKHFPHYTKDVITIDELNEIKEYCKQRFIDLVPSQNSLGHMGKWVEIPEVAEMAIRDDDGVATATLNPLDERSIEFVKTLYADLFPHFDSEFANINMDEPSALGKGTSKADCERLGKSAIYIEYLNKAIKTVNEQYNKTAMFWDDIIMQDEAYIGKILPNSIVMIWGYEENWPYSSRCTLVRKHNLRFYTCPSTLTFGTFTGRFNNMLENVENAAINCILHGGEGMLLTEWGDGGHSQFDVMFFLPLIFAACCAWHYNVDWPGGISTISHLDYTRMSDIVTRCEAYADMFIFGVRGMGRALHKAANYYLVENNNILMGTKLWYDVRKLSNGQTVKIDSLSLHMVIDYMNSVKSEFLSFPQETPHLLGAICNCDMVLLCAKAFCAISENATTEEKTAIVEELEKLKERFVQLWCQRNRERGSYITVNTLDALIKALVE